MSEKPNRIFITYFYNNTAWRALSQEDRQKELANIVKKKPEVQKKLGVKEYFMASPYGVPENGVLVIEADCIETKNQYTAEIGLSKWIENPRTITCIRV